MKKIFASILILATLTGRAQETVLPVPKQTGTFAITNATIHIGNGQVIEKGTVVVTDGKIVSVGANAAVPQGAQVTDASRQHLYPGLILPVSNLGLVEISSVRASNDVSEIGELNPNVRALAAYNTDSKIINTLRSNGILLANIVPEGGVISGTSSVVQLDAWNWEDAAYKTDAGIHFRMPLLMPLPRQFGGGTQGGAPRPDPVKTGLETIDRMKTFFREAKAYNSVKDHTQTSLQYAAVKGLFDKKQKLYVHANTVKQMLIGMEFAKEFGFDVVLVGASEAWQIADLIKQSGVSVVLNQAHALPTTTDDDVDQPYKTAAALKKAGVTFALNDEDSQNRGRNLAFNAGTAAAYGLTKEEALQAITLNAAKVLGVDDRTGSIEVGKDANIILSTGDILDMRTSNVTHAFIQGRKIDLTDKQKLLNERYKTKYGLKAPF